MRNAICSFANGNGNYMKSLARLSDSLRDNFDGDFISWVGESSLGCPPHSENPYAFKVYAIRKALQMGYENILWVDSSCYAIANVKPVFDHIDKNGYIMQEAGHMAGSWTNDETLAYFGITRDEAMKMPMYGNAGFLGLNASNKTAMEFFNLWEASMLAGMFKGSWSNHRHDMSCGSIIANQLGMKYESGENWLQYAAPEDKPLNDTIIFKAQGM